MSEQPDSFDVRVVGPDDRDTGTGQTPGRAGPAALGGAAPRSAGATLGAVDPGEQA